MGRLVRKLFRDMRAARWQFAAVVSLVAMSVAMFIGAYGGYLSLETSFNHSYKELDMADYWLKLDEAPLRAVAKLNAIPGVTAEGRIVKDLQVSVHEGSPERIIGHIVSLPGRDGPVLNRVVVEEGAYFSGPYALEALLNKKFASYHGFVPGDSITLKIGDDSAPFKVVGIVNSPEYFFTGPARNYGVIFMPRDSAEKLLDMKGYVNELAIQLNGDRADEGAAAESFREIGLALREYNVGRLEFKDSPTPLETRKTDISRGVYTARVIAQKDHPSDRTLRMDLEAFSRLAIIFPITNSLIIERTYHLLSHSHSIMRRLVCSCPWPPSPYMY